MDSQLSRLESCILTVANDGPMILKFIKSEGANLDGFLAAEELRKTAERVLDEYASLLMSGQTNGKYRQTMQKMRRTELVLSEYVYGYALSLIEKNSERILALPGVHHMGEGKSIVNHFYNRGDEKQNIKFASSSLQMIEIIDGINECMHKRYGKGKVDVVTGFYIDMLKKRLVSYVAQYN